MKNVSILEETASKVLLLYQEHINILGLYKIKPKSIGNASFFYFFLLKNNYEILKFMVYLNNTWGAGRMTTINFHL